MSTSKLTDKQKPKVGRKGKYSPELVNELMDFISCGMSNKSACEGAGISEKTFYEWMDKSEFSKKVNKAHAEFKKTHLKNISDQGTKDWRASAELLKLCHPKEYSQNAKIDLGLQEGTKTLKIELSDE